MWELWKEAINSNLSKIKVGLLKERTSESGHLCNKIAGKSGQQQLPHTPFSFHSIPKVA